ncbi:TlpA disulfide reductase family protein [Runella sp. MFBS21]|uniref:TlpA family protein disulfide reductase n=1 Tax=Runella sp. MFBS21 TaxID=3034018 RepID=UPI0023F9760F|nr:TlpA disulfide reductase family protein [Runella sp. MFBS21]MDF7819549.1 TlpA disulfide reductase family protein [Runella sp. MFBS21]
MKKNNLVNFSVLFMLIVYVYYSKYIPPVQGQMYLLEGRSDTISIYNNIKKHNSINWQVVDGYEDASTRLEFNSASLDLSLNLVSKLPIKVSTIDIDSTKPFFENESWVSFILYPGDRLEAYKDIEGFTRLRSLKDSVRTNELNFTVDLKQHIGEISAFKGVFSVKIPVNEQVDLSKKRAKKVFDYLNIYDRRKMVSKGFRSYVYNNFKFDVIHYMMRDYFSPFIMDKYKKPFPDKLISVYDTLNKEFDCNECVFIDNYNISALLYAYFLCYKKGVKNDVYNLYSVVKENFKDKTKDYLLFRVVKMKMEEDMQESGFKYMLNNFYKDCKDENYVAYIKRNMSVMENVTPLQKSFMSSELFGMESKKILIKNLIESSKDKLTYIDLWASWCSPCIAEMPISHQLQQLYKGKKINFIFISLDKSRVAWENGMIRAKLNQSKDSYLLINGSKSAFAKHFKISSIPRYILIGKDGKVINADAPRPSDPKIRELFDELLKK